MRIYFVWSVFVIRQNEKDEIICYESINDNGENGEQHKTFVVGQTKIFDVNLKHDQNKNLLMDS